MELAYNEFEGYDLDWYLVGLNNVIIHLISGGGHLPVHIAENYSKMEILTDFFTSLDMFDDDGNLMKLSNPHEEMARIGLYSFDKGNIEDPLDSKYVLLHSPVNELLLEDLPKDIADLLITLRVDIDPLKEHAINVKGILC